MGKKFMGGQTVVALERRRSLAKAIIGGLGIGLLVVAVQMVFVAPAFAAGTHVFDAALSLTGGTGTSKLDPVPDPGPSHPPKPFSHPCGVAVDSAGDVYVPSLGEEEGGETTNGRIDVFDAEGHFLVEIPNEFEPCQVAVDSKGNVYVVQRSTAQQALVRYAPSSYPPTPTTTYGSPILVDAVFGIKGLAVDMSTDHVFAARAFSILEFSSAEEGNAVLRSDIGEGVLNDAHGVAVDSGSGDIFVGSLCTGCEPLPNAEHEFVSVVYVLDSSGTVEATIDGSDIPAQGGFKAIAGQLFPAIDEASGELFIAETGALNKVYRYVPAGETYEYESDPELEEHGYQFLSGISVSNLFDETKGYVYVPSFETDHLYVFSPAGVVGAPTVSEVGVDDVATEEARFSGEVNPGGATTTYRFQYVDAVTYQQDEELLGPGHGFDHAASTEPQTLFGGHQNVSVSAVAGDLTPGTAYRVRLVAENHCSVGAPEESCTVASAATAFATYSASPIFSCPNETLRVGPSASLPDCRAYELVTPPDTNGRKPTAVPLAFAFDSFATELATASGESLLFMTEGGSLPGLGGNGIADGYEASRSNTGWSTRLAGPTGGQTQAPGAGGASADHGYWFWETGGESDHGSLVVGGEKTHYVRLPDGSFRLIGTGPAGTDPRAIGRWIAPGGSHIVFTSRVPLTPEASPEGTSGIYDTWSDGTTHLVSVDASGQAPAAGAVVEYLGTSADGSAVAFSVAQEGTTTLYVHRSGEPSSAAVTSGAFSYAGLSADGRFLTYVKGGNIFSFDWSSQTSTPVGSGGQSTPVNVSADGSHVYFVSTQVLGSDPGPTGGKQNFYVWEAGSGTTSYIARLTTQDVKGRESGGGLILGLGQWTEWVGPSQNLAYDPSRTTPDGRSIVFESHAKLTGYDSAGHAEVYRYSKESQPSLLCLSCNPTLKVATADAHLQIPALETLLAVTAGRTPIHNIADDGHEVFFQSTEPLVPGDLDGQQDVYEWESDGTGGCQLPAGCISLISSGHSIEPEYLYAATPSGSDVFFASADVLAAPDVDTTVSIYDARVNGGFAQENSAACLGGACKGPPSTEPAFPAPATLGGGKYAKTPPKHCRKGFKKVRRKGKARCIRRAHRRHRHHRHQANHRGNGGRQ